METAFKVVEEQEALPVNEVLKEQRLKDYEKFLSGTWSAMRKLEEIDRKALRSGDWRRFEGLELGEVQGILDELKERAMRIQACTRVLDALDKGKGGGARLGKAGGGGAGSRLGR